MSSKVESLRKEIETLSAEIETVSRAPVSRAELEQRIRTRLEAADHGSPIDARLGGFTGPKPGPVDLQIDMALLITVLGVDAVLKPIADLLIARFGEGLDVPERDKKLKMLRAKLHELEVAEEVEIMKIEGGGPLYDRRADAGIEALLEAWKQ